jgi:hypothetical protein
MPNRQVFSDTQERLWETGRVVQRTQEQVDWWPGNVEKCIMVLLHRDKIKNTEIRTFGLRIIHTGALKAPVNTNFQ